MVLPFSMHTNVALIECRRLFYIVLDQLEVLFFIALGYKINYPYVRILLGVAVAFVLLVEAKPKTLFSVLSIVIYLI